MSNEINIEELERLAKAAAPGPWRRQDFQSSGEKNGIDDSDGDVVCASYGRLRPKSFDFIAAANPSAVLSLIDRLKKAEAELERERMRLAACGVVAMADTPESAAKAREMRDEYRSASCDDVARRVDECMTLRVERDALTARLKKAEAEVEQFRTDARRFRLAEKNLFDAQEAAKTIAKQAIAAEAERDALAAKLAELEGQEPTAWMNAKRDMASFIHFHEDDLPLFARPVPAEPVNVDFGMRGENMFFQIGNQSFLLDYKPEEQGEFEFMKAMLLSAFSRISHGVKTQSQPVNVRLLNVSTGKLGHINAGLCPDSINGPDSRDPACPACRAIAEADADSKLENILHKFGEADFPPGYCLDPMCSREEMEAQQEKPKD